MADNAHRLHFTGLFASSNRRPLISRPSKNLRRPFQTIESASEQQPKQRHEQAGGFGALDVPDSDDDTVRKVLPNYLPFSLTLILDPIVLL